MSSLDSKIEQSYRRLRIKYDKYLNTQDCPPSQAKKHIIDALNNSIKNCLNISIKHLGNIEDNKGTLFFSKPDVETPFPFDVLSAGEKEVIDLLLDLYIRKDFYTDSIYIIDEPELHLNTAIQRKLLIEINKLVPQNCQIWIATHSIGFLRALQEECKEESCIIEFDAKNEWASRTYTLTPQKMSRSSWKKIFSTALDDLTNLISPKTIIYCEGRAEPGKNGRERGFDAQVFNKIFNEKYPDVLFVSSGGNTEPDQRSEIALTILTKIFNGLTIWVLKDRDISSGKPNTEKDRIVYLKNNNSSHRILRRWEIENYLFDKEILKSYCIAEGLTFDENSYDAFVTDITNQNLKDEVNRIKNFCGITTSVNIEKFKINLADNINEGSSVFKELEEEIFERK